MNSMEGKELRLYQAMQQMRIRDLPNEELTRFISGLIAQCFFMVGYQTYDAKVLTLLTAKLVTLLRDSYPNLTREEIAFCFEEGATGTYGDYIGINLRAFKSWLRAYNTSNLRYKIKVELQRESTRRALPPVSPETREAEERRYLEYVFRQYKAGYPLERFHVARIYRILQERGIISHTPEEKWAAVRLFERYKPETRGNLPVDEELRLLCVKRKAMEWLLKREFDRRERLF